MSPLRTRLLLVAVLVAALLGGGAYLARRAMELDASAAVLLAGDARSSHAYERLGSVMGDRLPLGILVGHDELFSNAGRDALFALSEELESHAVVNDVKSLTHSRRPVRKPGFHLDPRQMVDNATFFPEGELTDEQWAAVREEVLSDPLAESVFVADDGSYAMVLAVAWGELDDERMATFTAAVESAAENHRDAFGALFVGGFPFLEREVRDTVRGDALTMLTTAAALVALILLVAFRSLWAVTFLLLLGGAGICGVPVLMALLGTGLNLYTAMLLPLVAGLQLTFLAHFVAAVLDGERAGLDGATTLRAALRKVSTASTLAAITTALGLLALRWCDVGLVQEFGLVGAAAVLLALVLSLLPGWALSLVMGPGQAVPPAPAPTARAGAFVAWLDRRRKLLAVTALLLGLGSVAAASQLRTDLRALGFLDEDSPSRQALSLIDERLGGLNAMQLRVDTGAAGGAVTREALAFLLELAAEAESLSDVSHVYHLGQVYARLEQLWRGGGPLSGADALPATDMQLALYTTLLKVVNVPLLDMLVDMEARVATIVVRAHDMPAAEWLAVLDHMVAFAEEHRPEGLEVQLQAGLHELLDADRRMVAAQRDSLAAAALAVLAVLSLVLRSVRMAGITVMCNLLPMVLVLGVMGVAGVTLDSITVMVGAVALGVAVDDAIHLLLWLRKTEGRWQDRLASTLAAKLVPVATTSAVMTTVFGLFLLSSFPPVRIFGLLGALAMLTALASTLVLLPALLLGDRTPDGESAA
jgi:predicted RND superfamily exporter protein